LVNIGSPSAVMRMLEGLTSRWIMFWRWVKSSGRATGGNKRGFLPVHGLAIELLEDVIASEGLASEC